MKKFLQLMIAVICVSLITGCASMRKPPKVAEPVHPAPVINPNACVRTLYPGSFDEVVIQGPLNVTIQGHQPANFLRINGSQDQLKATSAYVDEGVLYVKYRPYLNFSRDTAPVSVTLNVAYPIRQLSFSGSGNLKATSIADTGLVLSLSGNTVTSLVGNNLLVQQIILKDQALLHTYWLNTSNLQVIAQDKSQVMLGGIVSNLDIIASGDANVDAKYLRVNNAYIKASDDADVGVNIKHLMSSWSTGNSTVYYYQDADFNAYYLDQAGAALRMVGIPNR